MHRPPLAPLWDLSMCCTCPPPCPPQDLDLKMYVQLVCGVLDIPVYENPIESLHVLFTLYLEFKSNPIFKQQVCGGGGMRVWVWGGACGC